MKVLISFCMICFFENMHFYTTVLDKPYLKYGGVLYVLYFQVTLETS